jgi:hypothetical protein
MITIMVTADQRAYLFIAPGTFFFAIILRLIGRGLLKIHLLLIERSYFDVVVKIQKQG